MASRTSYLIPFTDVIHDILFSDDPTAQHTLSNITSQNCCLSKYHLCERYVFKGCQGKGIRKHVTILATVQYCFTEVK